MLQRPILVNATLSFQARDVVEPRERTRSQGLFWLEAETIQRARTALPIGVHLHANVEVNPRPEQRFQLTPSASAGISQEGAALADDDAFL